MIDINNIRDGIERGEFFLQYLPTISLSSGRCIGAEALIRWRQPDRVVPPDEFIPLIENTPLSGLITYWVLDTVAAELGDWLRAYPDLHVGINVPPEIIGRGGMEYAAKRSGLMELASQVILEITERGIPDSLAVDAINQAAQAGIKVALDDVTLLGGANLAVLIRCDLFYFKLDRSLIFEITPECPHPEWLQSLAALLKLTNLLIIAEGVETQQQFETLRASNIKAAQGFYFSRPISTTELFSFHRRRNT
jgi:sensor c-di-GMP phosphodiesterase-like protein